VLCNNCRVSQVKAMLCNGIENCPCDFPLRRVLVREIPDVPQNSNRGFLDADMSTLRHWTGAASDTPNSTPKSVGRPASIGILAATTVASLLCGGGAALSGPCTTQIEQLEQQFGHLSSSAKSGLTAPQSFGSQLDHQPTPETVRDADADAAAL
jgi:hypothetical protein